MEDISLRKSASVRLILILSASLHVRIGSSGTLRCVEVLSSSITECVEEANLEMSPSFRLDLPLRVLGLVRGASEALGLAEVLSRSRMAR